MSPRTESHSHPSAAHEEPSNKANTNNCTTEGIDTSTVIFPRRKAGQNKRPSTQAPVVVTFEVLQEVFDMPLWKACKNLGICATAMKKVCRKLGVMEWPYKKNHMPGKRNKSQIPVQTGSPADSASSTECEETEASTQPAQSPTEDNASSPSEHKTIRPLAIAAALKITRAVRSKIRAARIAEKAVAAPRFECFQFCEREEQAVEMEISEKGSPSFSDEADDDVDECPIPDELVSLQYYEPNIADGCEDCSEERDSQNASCFAMRTGNQVDGMRIALGDQAHYGWDVLDNSWLRQPDLMGSSFDQAIAADLEMCF